MGAGPVSGGVLARLRRGVWPGANPLRRRTDLFEPVALLVLSAAAVVVLICSFVASQAVLRDHLGQVNAERAQRHEVTARVLSDVPGQDSAVVRSVAVGWGPEPQRVAVVEVPTGTRLADTLQIWVDPQGRPVPPPRTRSEATQAAGTAGAAVLLGSGLVLGGLFAAARWYVGRRRLAAWEQEWAEIGPRWRHHHP
ncbi:MULTISPECIES: hypothetical protein [Saccharopolyspora]|uniref:Transmembrane protein n=1 Tax=Saccharopolyspora gregorii TaxID=33914 RepID=A0ABP6RNL9_9PSEU|nr:MULTISPECIES: hypothetical protein [Saccharopolyspora]MCA1187787.1 hypothetical protein [Saccharopolyspora sp. 6T]MCA1190969.1 hypothetical protein [Saccharopolyspora sp. 6V]MCA1227652.1 hypothetical protein [Saccharopolyspora sp. 6M]MCA1279853.1 hypothetical protein [Saccharopolyspora sp. 7B]